MDIPNNVEEIEIYYDRVLTILEQWSWLYQHRPTEILLTNKALTSEYLNILEKVDIDSLNQIPLGVSKEDWPEQLKYFIEECSSLTLKLPVQQIQPLQLTVPNKFRKCISVKKQHEVNNLAPFILEHCQQSNITRIFDIGSGLGYIDRILANVGMAVVGVELDACKIEKAIKLNNELLERNHSTNITYIDCRLDDSNLEQLCQQLQCYEENGCLVGLHACGDLSAVSLRVFLKMKNLRTLLLVPCCYHKMTNTNSFPVGSALKNKLSDKKPIIINTNLLRIASECTRERWCNKSEELHLAHAFHVLARAVVEKFLSDHNYKTERKRRRCVSKQHLLNWQDYVNSWIDRHTVIEENGTVVSSSVVHSQLATYWSEYCHLTKRIIVYTCLQVCLQGVAESLLVIDRLLYLSETGQICASAVRVTDPVVSPRSITIVAKKL